MELMGSDKVSKFKQQMCHNKYSPTLMFIHGFTLVTLEEEKMRLNQALFLFYVYMCPDIPIVVKDVLQRN